PLHLDPASELARDVKDRALRSFADDRTADARRLVDVRRPGAHLKQCGLGLRGDRERAQEQSNDDRRCVTNHRISPSPRDRDERRSWRGDDSSGNAVQPPALNYAQIPRSVEDRSKLCAEYDGDWGL